MASRKFREGGDGIVRGILDNFLALRPVINRVVGRITRPEDIEDIVQETFVHSYAAARDRHIHNPKAFMLKTAKNLALNLISLSEYRLTEQLDDTVDSDSRFASETLESQYQSREKFLLFCRAVSALPVNCRRVFILKKVYGLSQKEIADYLDISPSTVEKHVAKGVVMTARYLSEKGYPVAVPAAPGTKSKRDEVNDL